MSLHSNLTSEYGVSILYTETYNITHQTEVTRKMNRKIISLSVENIQSLCQNHQNTQAYVT